MATSAYERRIQNYMAAHPGATRAEARGHGRTPEHGGILRGVPRHVHTAGRDIYASYSDRSAEQAINRAADHENRVQIMVHTKDDGWLTIGGSGGYRAAYVADMIGDAEDIRTAITGGYLSGSSGGPGIDSDSVDGIDYDDIDAWEIVELE